MKIRYKLHSARTEMYIDKKGDWIDLRSAEDKVLEKGCYTLISLGIATPWQKIKWLFTKKIEFVEVQHLGNESRGGFGSTGRR
jgi:dUTPase